MQDRKKLPALDKSLKVKNPDLPDIYNRNYTDKILKYAGLATQFPQLETNAKTLVDAINELYSGGGGDGKHRTLTQAEYDELTEEEKNDGTIYFITDAPSVFIRPEDLEAGDALDGQLLTFYKNSSNIGVWTATPMIRNLHNGDAIMWSSEYGTWVNGVISSGKSNLSELDDVNLSDLQSGQILKYDGTDWVNATEGDLSNYYTKSETDVLLEAKADVSDLPDMSDYYTKSATDTLLSGKANVGDVPEDIQDLDNVTISSASNGQVLTYSNGNWVNADASSGASSLDELTDVSISSVQSGQVLQYDGSDWINANVGNANIWEGTQAQYDAILVKDPDTVYFITDADSDTFSADAVEYDNTDSGLSATTVQSAIDEIVEHNVYWTDLTGTLITGQTSIQFHDSVIKSTSTVQVFVDSAFYGVSPTSMTVINSYVTLDFDEQSSNMPVKVRIS